MTSHTLVRTNLILVPVLVLVLLPIALVTSFHTPSPIINNNYQQSQSQLQLQPQPHSQYSQRNQPSWRQRRTNPRSLRLRDSPPGMTAAVNGDSTSATLEPSRDDNNNNNNKDNNKDTVDGDKSIKSSASTDQTTSTIDVNMFELLAGRAATCLAESDLQLEATGKDNTRIPNSSTTWIDEKNLFAFQRVMEKIKLKLPDEQKTPMDRDDAFSWIRWMKSSPTPMIVDVSKTFQSIINATVITDQSMERIDQTREQFLARLRCRLVLLPSGASLKGPLLEPSSSLICGKLLYGGITRYRLIGSHNSNRSPRKAGERTDIMVSSKDNLPTWIQYGGPERMYEAVDMGPCAALEVLLMAPGQGIVPEKSPQMQEMMIENLAWRPERMFGQYMSENGDGDGGGNEDGGSSINDQLAIPISLSGSERNDAFQSDFESSVGGLQKEISSIVRRVLDGRVIRPADEDDNTAITDKDSMKDKIKDGAKDEVTTQLSRTAMEAEELLALGLTPVRGLLLYGPPGCGKTALAREIARALRARKPKIASAPELLDRWVGGSEKLVRSLFADAEAELAACNGDVTKSALHVIVIDEVDAVFRRRSAGEDSGEATRASVVNQILAKMDGVNSIDNVLLIGMTNRRELLDEALLRPGRLEVQIEIPLPDREGRREILKIHFDALRKRGRLSKPLCSAIDGMPSDGMSMDGFWGSGSVGVGVGASGDVGTAGDGSNSQTQSVSPPAPSPSVSPGRKRAAVRHFVGRVLTGASSAVRPTYDLAASYATGGFSGADIAGLVRCAGSIALARSREDGNGVDGLVVTLEDVKQALGELKK